MIRKITIDPRMLNINQEISSVTLLAEDDLGDVQEIEIAEEALLALVFRATPLLESLTTDREKLLKISRHAHTHQETAKV